MTDSPSSFVLQEIDSGVHAVWILNASSGGLAKAAEIRATDGAYRVFAAGRSEPIDDLAYGWLDTALGGFRSWFASHEHSLAQ